MEEKGVFKGLTKSSVHSGAEQTGLFVGAFPGTSLSALICTGFLWSAKFFHFPKSLGWASYRTFFLWVSSFGYIFNNLYHAFMYISEPLSVPLVVTPFLDNATPAG